MLAEQTQATDHGHGSGTSRVARGALLLLSAQPITWTASLLNAIFLPRYLGADALGEFALATTIALLMSSIVALGIPDYLVKRIATDPDGANRSVGATLIIVIALEVAGALLLGTLLPLFDLPVSAGALRLALASVVVATGQYILMSMLRGQERHGLYSWLNALPILLGGLLGIGALWAGADLVQYMAVLLAGTSAATVAAALTSGFRLHRASLDRRLWRELIRGGVPMLGVGVATRLRSEADRILIPLLATTAAAGWYAAAYRIAAIPLFIPVLVTTPLLPALSRQAANPAAFRHTLHRCVWMMFVITLPICVALFALAPAVPELLRWPASFGESVSVLRILAVQQPIMSLAIALGTALIALNHERRVIAVIAGGAALNCALNVALIPLAERAFGNGALGAAAVTLGTEVVMLGAIIALIPRGLIGRSTAGVCLRAAAAGMCQLAVMVALRDLLPLAVAAGGLTFLGAAVAVRALRMDDLAGLMRIVTETAPRRLLARRAA